MRGTDSSCPLASIGRGDGDPVQAVAGEYPIEAGQVNLGVGNQR